MLIYLIIVASFCAIYPLVPRKHIKWLFLALVLALSVMAFFVKPLPTDDLMRYYDSLELLRKKSFAGYLNLQRMRFRFAECIFTLSVNSAITIFSRR